jgi:hypothetical protein
MPVEALDGMRPDEIHFVDGNSEKRLGGLIWNIGKRKLEEDNE